MEKDPTTETLASGISEVVNAFLGVGAAVAKTVAQATAPGKPVPPGAPGEGPFADMVHYGVTAASNLAKLVIPGVRSTATTGGVAANCPVVHAGATLRIPLSIENPSDVAMSNMIFRSSEIQYLGNAPGVPLGALNIVFQPEILTIAPRDFEKLTVFIETTELTAIGPYLAKVTVENGSFECVLRFEVILAKD